MVNVTRSSISQGADDPIFHELRRFGFPMFETRDALTTYLDKNKFRYSPRFDLTPLKTEAPQWIARCKKELLFLKDMGRFTAFVADLENALAFFEQAFPIDESGRPLAAEYASTQSLAANDFLEAMRKSFEVHSQAMKRKREIDDDENEVESISSDEGL